MFTFHHMFIFVMSTQSFLLTFAPPFPSSEELNVAVTEVSGTIPSTIGLMTSLTSLDMFELPTMEGTLPEQFGNLTNLGMIILYFLIYLGRIVDKTKNSDGGLKGKIMMRQP